MASIVKKTRQRGSAYFVVYRLDGKQRWKFGGRRRTDAERLKARIEHGLHTGTYQELPDITFKELAEKWLELKESQVRPKTFASYRPHVERLITAFGQYKVKNISQEMVERFAANLSAQGIAPATASRCLTLAGSIFRKGMQWGYLSKNPAEFVVKPKVPKPKVDILEPDEIKQLIDATDPRYHCLIMFACLTGCRQSEILGLRWADVDLANGRVFIRQTLQGNQFFEPKTESSRRVIDLLPVLVEELKTHQVRQAVELPQNPYDLVFTSLKGTPMKGRNVTQRILEPALKRAGLRKVGFHSLRHSYVSMLIAQGENVKTIQALVGHSSAKVTWDRYSHLFSGTTKKAVLRLGDRLFQGEKTLKVSLKEQLG
jgi:integrase